MAVIRITSHTKIRRVKSILESAIQAGLVTRHFNLGVPEVTVKNYTSCGNNWKGLPVGQNEP